jgi:uncharacterized membrane protein YhaH (DUF805 family)
MDMSLFTSFQGRINRAKWWLGSIIMIVIGAIVGWIVGSIIGASIFNMVAEGGITPETIASATRKISISQLITVAILAYPVTALMTKRLNDRDRPNYLVYVFWLPTVLTILAGLAGLTMTVADVNGVMMPTQSSIGMILGLLSLVIGIWALVELGILKGTAGPNQHGPDPLGGA